MIKAIIVDDEEAGRVTLERLIENYCFDVKVVGKAEDIIEAGDLIRALKPHVVFLDIEMPGGNGFKLLEQFDHIDFDIVFVTAYHQYAIKALRFSALDYLLKPVNISELQESIDRIKKKQTLAQNGSRYSILKNSLHEGDQLTKIVISTAQGFHILQIEEIIYCKGEGSYTYFFMKGGVKYMVSKNLKEYEDMLDNLKFMRIHKTYLINLKHIEHLTRTEGATVRMSNGDNLPVSYRKKEQLIQTLKNS
ncbi:MAG: response regulator transcription factor [Bacteroidetes bacterium]|nr:response regulator transcription factor [Bacteroidota bacterium]